MALTEKDIDRIAQAAVNKLLHAPIEDPQDKSKKPISFRRLLVRIARRED